MNFSGGQDDIDVPERGNYFLMPPQDAETPVGQPKYVAMRMDCVVPEKLQDILWKRYANVVQSMKDELARKTRKTSLHAGDGQTEDSGFFLGVWMAYSAGSHPIATAGYKNQAAEVKKAMDGFLWTLTDQVVPKILEVVEEFDPGIFSTITE